MPKNGFYPLAIGKGVAFLYALEFFNRRCLPLVQPGKVQTAAPKRAAPRRRSCGKVLYLFPCTGFFDRLFPKRSLSTFLYLTYAARGSF